MPTTSFGDLSTGAGGAAAPIPQQPPPPPDGSMRPPPPPFAPAPVPSLDPFLETLLGGARSQAVRDAFGELDSCEYSCVFPLKVVAATFNVNGVDPPRTDDVEEGFRGLSLSTGPKAGLGDPPLPVRVAEQADQPALPKAARLGPETAGIRAGHRTGPDGQGSPDGPATDGPATNGPTTDLPGGPFADGPAASVVGGHAAPVADSRAGSDEPSLAYGFGASAGAPPPPSVPPPPRVDLTAWLSGAQDADILAVGIQELVPLSAANVVLSRSAAVAQASLWDALIHENLAHPSLARSPRRARARKGRRGPNYTPRKSPRGRTDEARVGAAQNAGGTEDGASGAGDPPGWPVPAPAQRQPSRGTASRAAGESPDDVDTRAPSGLDLGLSPFSGREESGSGVRVRATSLAAPISPHGESSGTSVREMWASPASSLAPPSQGDPRDEAWDEEEREAGAVGPRSSPPPSPPSSPCSSRSAGSSTLPSTPDYLSGEEGLSTALDGDPDDWCLVASRGLVGLHLSVWARRGLLPSLSDPRGCAVGTGLMGYLGNKGAVAVRLRCRDSNILFVNAHLASGESEADEAKRHADAAEILRRAQLDPLPPLTLAEGEAAAATAAAAASAAATAAAAAVVASAGVATVAPAGRARAGRDAPTATEGEVRGEAGEPGVDGGDSQWASSDPSAAGPLSRGDASPDLTRASHASIASPTASEPSALSASPRLASLTGRRPAQWPEGPWSPPPLLRATLPPAPPSCRPAVPPRLDDADAAIWMGDLNYRLRGISHGAAVAAIRAGAAPDLFSQDELSVAMRAGRAFAAGWREAPPPFPPTFKFKHGQAWYVGEAASHPNGDDASEPDPGPGGASAGVGGGGAGRVAGGVAPAPGLDEAGGPLRRGLGTPSVAPGRGGRRQGGAQGQASSGPPPRTPAWTDRVLHRNFREGDLMQTAYGCAPSIDFSDHRPVWAAFAWRAREYDRALVASALERARRAVDAREMAATPRAVLDPAALELGPVRYGERVRTAVSISNPSEVTAAWRLVPPGPGQRATPPWLAVTPSQGELAPGQTARLLVEAVVLGGAAGTADALALAAPAGAGRGPRGGEAPPEPPRLEAVLFLRVQGGKDAFLAVGGDYLPSFFGVDPTGTLRALPWPILGRERGIPASPRDEGVRDGWETGDGRAAPGRTSSSSSASSSAAPPATPRSTGVPAELGRLLEALARPGVLASPGVFVAGSDDVATLSGREPRDGAGSPAGVAVASPIDSGHIGRRSGGRPAGADASLRAEVLAIRDALDAGRDPPASSSPRALAASLLAWIASLPTSLLPASAAHVCDVAEATTDVVAAVVRDGLGEAHRAVLEAVLGTLRLALTPEASAENGLNAAALATVLADVWFSENPAARGTEPADPRARARAAGVAAEVGMRRILFSQRLLELEG